MTRRRRRGAVIAGALGVAGPVLAIATYATLTTSQQDTLSSLWFKALILADVVYLVLLTSLIGLQLARLIVARRANSAGSRLHGRMVAFFTGVAAAPALLVSVFFFLVIQLGFDAWFSEQVSGAVSNAQEIATSYERAHRSAIAGEAVALAQTLNRAAASAPLSPRDPDFWRWLGRTAGAADFDAVYFIDSGGGVIARDQGSFLHASKAPSAGEMTRAARGAVVLDDDRELGEVRVLIRLDALFDAYLYLVKVDADGVGELVARTERAAQLYTRLERNRESWIAQFAVLYLGFVVLVLAASLYLGLWFAERMTRPIGRLAAAAQRVRGGDLFVRVKEEQGDDEVALLSRTFNRMTEEVERKQRDLTAAHADSEERRAFTETVLSGVSAGVIGLDAEGRILLANRSANALLAWDPAAVVGRPLVEVAPEFEDLLKAAAADASGAVERPIHVRRGGRDLELLARVTAQPVGEPRGAGAVDDLGGFVLTIDDVTALAAAQRMAAWGDVARRIAHEIKNPLTPIQLAAERLRRKYRDRLGDDGEVFERYTETIVRQTGDIGRMVDAFVRLAKMPAPAIETHDIAKTVREAVLLQEEARAHIRYSVTLPDAPVSVRCDRGQISQALTNLLQNAADALQTANQPDPEIRVALRRVDADSLEITVSDNGIGLPTENRGRLTEPYVTTREKGAGLGLAIVLKIIEEHGGVFDLTDAAPFAEGAPVGAMARITLPRVEEAPSSVGREMQQETAASPEATSTKRVGELA